MKPLYSTMILAVVPTLISLANSVLGQCDYYTNVQPNQEYYVYSPYYSNPYPPSTSCRWIAACPQGYYCQLQCSDIDLPYTTGCTLDRLLISRTGDPTLAGAQSYCGRGTLTVSSEGQQLSVGLQAARNSPGGKFFCTLTAQPRTPAPTPTCSCGYRKVNRIVGGTETGVNEYPMMAGIYDKRIFQVYCGGVIIDRRYVVTAAHCMQEMDAANINAVVGDHNVDTTGESPATQSIPVTQFLIHPNYNADTFDYDISILRLQYDIVFSERVGPVCLPFNYGTTDFAGAIVTALGWGTKESGGPLSPTLQKVNLNVINQSTCQRTYSSLTSRQMCTYTPGKDACQFDSGGPLLYTQANNGLQYFVGIISYGKFCASTSPSVNARVTELLSWIVSSTPGVNYCRK
ncbi:hypothetical protein JYU34_015452 [Plutella xylostella]|uniref:Uncharacterized protein n=1 Tax=Plutella xylostella TaxID=51655 RepID=A0ABQ7Q8P3_PLUXY|nr:hypothetical protein JYU34_015452 [Plutella xylostella]